MAKDITPTKYYTAREAVPLLDGRVTEETVKRYCRQGVLNDHLKLDVKKMGPKRQWHILGASLRQIRRAWDLEDS